MQSNDRPAKTMWAAYVGALGLIFLFGGFGVDVFHQISKQRYAAEGTYYQAADALRHGRDPYVGASNGYPYVYPPLYAFCFEPLTNLPEPAAARVMVGIDGFFVLTALLLTSCGMLRRLGGETEWGNLLFVAMIAAVIVSIPIHNELRGLETNSLLLLSFALAFYFLDRWPVLAGIALAVAINIKYLPIVAVPYFCLRRRWTAAVSTLVASLALALLPAISIGWTTNLHYLHEAVSGLGHLAGSDATGGSAKVNGTESLSSLSITSTVARLAAKWNLNKPIQLLIAGMIAALWGGMLLIGYRLRRLPILKWPNSCGQREAVFQSLVAIEWAAVVTFALVFSPNTQNRNLVLAIIPAALAAALICSPIQARWRGAVGIASGAMLIGLTLPVAAMGKPFTRAWLSAGGPCWCLLITFIVLAWAGMSVAKLKNAGRRS